LTNYQKKAKAKEKKKKKKGIEANLARSVVGLGHVHVTYWRAWHVRPARSDQSDQS
jgi:hypothetical protein